MALVVDGPYRVVRVPVWGHEDSFGIRGEPRQGGCAKTPVLKNRDRVQKLCDRLNADYQRYQFAVWAKGH